MKWIIFTSILIGVIFSCVTKSREILSVQSPDKQIIVETGLKSIKDDGSEHLRLFYNVRFDNKKIILDSPLALRFQSMPEIGTDLMLEDFSRTSVDEKWERLWGKDKHVRNFYNEIILHLRELSGSGRKIDLIIRAYNDAVALRYYLPKDFNKEVFRLSAEHTTFHLAGNHTVWAANYGGFISHQESEFNKQYLNDLDSTAVYGCPLLIKTDPGWMALTEANLTDWAGLYFSRKADHTLVSVLSPRLDEPKVLVKSTAPRYSPWRVIMLGKSPGDLIKSDVIANLNDPCRIKDPSWIQPGKSAWDWWWCNRFAPDAGFNLGSNTGTMKYFIDFAAQMGWKYQLIDWHWYGEPFLTWDPEPLADPDADITTSNPDIDIPALVQYAKLRNVRLLLWLEWSHAEKQMDEAFPLYEKWGIAGVKVDFMQRDDQEMVNFYHRLIKKAAEHHLLVDFHGAYKPTGFSRTFPNAITREGVLGNEYTKWSDRVTPDHNVTIPFTRGLLGEMDFTPGAFVQVARKNFKAEEDIPPPTVMGTRCHQLAMLVVFESTLQVLCDSPYNYRKNPAGLDFLKVVPTTWMQTQVLNGEVGEYITVAREALNGDWFIGSMTNWDERSLSVKLNFLDDRTYSAVVWEDAPDSESHPEHLSKRQISVDRNTRLEARLAAGGGFVMHLQRQ